MTKTFLTDEQKQELKNLCNDVLGDHMELRAFTIRDIRGFGTIVTIDYPGLVYAPKEIIREDWEMATNGTQFEGTSLFFPA